MITSQARKNITKHTDEITKELDVFVTNLEKWTTPAQQEIDKAGRTAGGMRVAFKEWVNLSGRINSAKFEIQKIPAETENVYDLYDKADKMMKVFDDIIFQMNLLRFLTGIEWSRMGEHGVPFEPIIKGLTALCEAENHRKDAAIKLVLEVDTQIQDEIKREAQSLLLQSAEALREAVNEGATLAEKLNALVIKMGAHGRGFALVARETEKSVSFLRNMETLLSETAGNDDFLSANKNLPSIGKIQDNAFQMNLNAFNAAVESARAGDAEDCTDCAQGVRDYAWRMHRTAIKCEELDKDYKRLVGLLSTKSKTSASHHQWKRLDDIMFQSGFLNTQLHLESERASHDKFLALSREFEKVRDTLIESNGDAHINIFKRFKNGRIMCPFFSLCFAIQAFFCFGYGFRYEHCPLVGASKNEHFRATIKTKQRPKLRRVSTTKAPCIEQGLSFRLISLFLNSLGA